MPIPSHLFECDDSLSGLYVPYKEALKLGLRFPIPQIVARFLSIYDLSLAQINPNWWRTLLSMTVIIGELGFKLEETEIWVMYCVKKNQVDEGRAYVSTISFHGLILNLPNS